MFKQYLSPQADLRSYYKDVPISHLDAFKALAKAMGLRFKVVYRGPRLGNSNSYCRRVDAKRFAAYAVSVEAYKPIDPFGALIPKPVVTTNHYYCTILGRFIYS